MLVFAFVVLLTECSGNFFHKPSSVLPFTPHLTQPLLFQALVSRHLWILHIIHDSSNLQPSLPGAAFDGLCFVEYQVLPLDTLKISHILNNLTTKIKQWPLSMLSINLLLTECEGRTGEYWPEVVTVRKEPIRAQGICLGLGLPYNKINYFYKTTCYWLRILFRTSR